MAPQALGFFSERPGAVSSENAQLANNSHDIALKPFLQTHFGRMPPELRERVFIELLATPPSHAGHDFTTISPAHRKSTTAPQRFVHIKASWRQVTQTCRQIYVESRPIFFAAKSYYLAKPQELTKLLGIYSILWPPLFRLDSITALCLRDFVREVLLYTKEQIDEIMSNPNDYRSRANTRQQLAERSFKMLKPNFRYSIKHLKNLRTIGLCFLVSEETMYVDLLHCLTGIQKGLVEFVDAFHWLIRPQKPGDVWSIQYACFSNGFYGKGKDDEAIPYDRLSLERDVTDIDSRAPELKEGDERYVAVQIQWPVMEKPPQEPLGSNEGDMDWPTASDSSDPGVSSPAFSETRLELPQDQVEDNTLEVTSEYEEPFADLVLDSNEADQSLFVGLDSEDSRDPQMATDADQEEDGSLLQIASEEVSEPRLATQSDHPTEIPSPLSSSALIAHDAPVPTASDRVFLPETDNETKNDTGASDPAALAEDLPHNDESPAKSKTQIDQVQQTLGDRVKGRSRRKTSNYLLGLEISKSPNPHTEEEMEDYEEWQESTISGTPVQKKKGPHKVEGSPPPCGKLRELPMDDPPMASTAETPQKERHLAVSRAPLRLLVRFIQAGTLFLLSLILAIITRPAKTSSDDRHSKNEPIKLQKEPLSQEI